MLNAAAILLISLHHKLDLQSYCELCYTLSKLWFVPHQYDLLNLCHHTTTGKCKGQLAVAAALDAHQYAEERRAHCLCGAPPPLSARTRSGLWTGTWPNCPRSFRSCPPHEPYRPLQLHGLLVQEEQAAEAVSVVLLPWNTLVFREPGQVDNTSSE